MRTEIASTKTNDFAAPFVAFFSDLSSAARGLWSPLPDVQLRRLPNRLLEDAGFDPRLVGHPSERTFATDNAIEDVMGALSSRPCV